MIVKFCVYRRLTVLCYHWLSLGSDIICLLSTPLFYSYWPQPIKVVLHSTYEILNTKASAEIWHKYVVIRWSFRGNKICFCARCFRLSSKGKDNLKIFTEDSWKPKDIFSDPYTCIDLFEKGEKKQERKRRVSGGGTCIWKAWGRTEPGSSRKNGQKFTEILESMQVKQQPEPEGAL